LVMPRGSSSRVGTCAAFALAMTIGRACPSGASFSACCPDSANTSRAKIGALNPTAVRLMNSLRFRSSLLIAPPGDDVEQALQSVPHFIVFSQFSKTDCHQPVSKLPRPLEYVVRYHRRVFYRW